jgi:hypothetical protein
MPHSSWIIILLLFSPCVIMRNECMLSGALSFFVAHTIPLPSVSSVYLFSNIRIQLHFDGGPRVSLVDLKLVMSVCFVCPSSFKLDIRTNIIRTETIWCNPLIW